MANSRILIDSAAKNHDFLRNIAIENTGQSVTIHVPTNIQTSIYNDKKTTSYDIFSENILINWSEYKILLDFFDESEESIVPLNAYTSTDTKITVGTIIDVVVETEKGKFDTKYYKVSKLRSMSNGSSYSREITMLPTRGVGF